MWNKVKIAVQGLGKIGLHLATYAARAGAEVFAVKASCFWLDYIIRLYDASL